MAVQAIIPLARPGNSVHVLTPGEVAGTNLAEEDQDLGIVVISDDDEADEVPRATHWQAHRSQGARIPGSHRSTGVLSTKRIRVSAAGKRAVTNPRRLRVTVGDWPGMHWADDVADRPRVQPETAVEEWRAAIRRWAESEIVAANPATRQHARLKGTLQRHEERLRTLDAVDSERTSLPHSDIQVDHVNTMSTDGDEPGVGSTAKNPIVIW